MVYGRGGINTDSPVVLTTLFESLNHLILTGFCNNFQWAAVQGTSKYVAKFLSSKATVDRTYFAKPMIIDYITRATTEGGK
jgi:hypothetical protein